MSSNIFNMIQFATYTHSETCATSKEVTDDMFVGNGFPHFKNIRDDLSKALALYPELPLRKVALAEYLRVHSAEYLDKLIRMSQDEKVDSKPVLSVECIGFEYCLPGYCYSLGGMYEAIDRMKAGTLDRAFCFSLGGHHAHRDWGHGYCLLNPFAAAARYAQQQGFKKVMIIDWDIHHGDGTQSIFAGDSSVYHISIHSAIDLYMSKVSSTEAGTIEYGRLVGHCNIPLLHPVFDDDFFSKINLDAEFYRVGESVTIFQKTLENVTFVPDIILLFAGCDSHKDDCGKDITDWDSPDYETLTKAVLDLSRKANCPVLATQGGGYNMPSTIAASEACVGVLATY